MHLLNGDIESMLIRNGATLVGFADIRCLPAEHSDGLPTAVSIAVKLDASVVQEIGNGPTRRYFAEYDRVNQLLTQLCDQVVRLLRGYGRQAVAMQATTAKLDRRTLRTRLPHKTVATRAGLGWIGKSALLITRRYGPAVRLGSVLTDADLQTGEPIETSRCGRCRRCVEACAAGAVSGENWQIGTDREAIYDAFGCRKAAKKLAGRQGIDAAICGICIHVCPWAQKYLQREDRRREVQGQVEIHEVRTDNDLNVARELFAEYERWLPFDLSFQNFEAELAGLPGRYGRPKGCILLARRDGEAVGCVALRPVGEDVCEMKRLFVRPDHRGLGVGRLLGEAIVERARQIGYSRMVLDTVLRPAATLYRSMGFRHIEPYQHVPIDGIQFLGRDLHP